MTTTAPTLTTVGGTPALYEFGASQAAMARALSVIPSGIPGHQGPSEGCYVPVSSFPLYSQRAEGSRFWDLDGNEFLDYMCGYGPNVLGYRDPVVDEAARRQAALEDVVTIPSSVMVDFAELLVDTVASADWAFFAKNGGDTTTLAVMTARQATHRKKIVFVAGYYHGVAPWTQKLDYPGVLEEDVANNLVVPWNDLAAVERVFREHRGQIAGFIAQPYMHGNFTDNQLPADGYWQGVRRLCDEHRVVLIVDDVVAAVVGFALAGVGVGALVPLTFSAAGELAPGRVDEVIARINLFNYIGAVLGAVVLGLLSAWPGLGVAFALPALLLLPALAASRRFDHPSVPTPSSPPLRPSSLGL